LFTLAHGRDIIISWWKGLIPNLEMAISSRLEKGNSFVPRNAIALSED
jgi:hypothetical protein